MNEELTKLIEKAINGDGAAFEHVMNIKAKHIYYIALKLMGDSLDAEDAAQEAMLKMYSHIGELKQPGAFQSWMYQTVARTCMNMRKKMTRDDHSYLETEDELNEMRREFLPQEYIEDVDKREFLMEVIDGLPEHYRISLLLFYYEGMSYQQIAKAMDTTEKVVDNVLQRARRRIKKKLEEKYDGKLTYASFQGAAAMPVLSQAFQLDAAAKATPEILRRILFTIENAVEAIAEVGGTASAASAAGTSTAASGTANLAAGASGSTAAGASAAGGSLSVSAKVVIGLVAAATAAGGSALLFQGNGVGSPGSLPAHEEQAILTLEDMIGQEAADRLRGYVSGSEEWELWEEYIAGIEASSLYSADDGLAVYTLYRLEKQDKQLLIIRKTPGEGAEGQPEAVFHFTDNHETAPERMALFERWEGWKS